MKLKNIIDSVSALGELENDYENSKKLSIGEFAALVASHLQSKGISTVLTGGAVVSYDADFISPADQKTISEAMQELGFKRYRKEFRHKQTDFFVEFPSGPLVIGNQPVQAKTEIEFKGYKLKLLSPTQSVMDRLAAYFHWNDLQCLDQAIWIAEKHPIRISQVKEWAKQEGEENKLNVFLKKLNAK